MSCHLLADAIVVFHLKSCAPRGSNPDTSDQESDTLPLGRGAHGRNGRNRTGDSPARGECVITTLRLCGWRGRARTAAGTTYEVAALPFGRHASRLWTARESN